MEHGTLDRCFSASLGLRTLAAFEVAKGAIVLLLTDGVLPARGHSPNGTDTHDDRHFSGASTGSAWTMNRFGAGPM